MIDPVAGQLSEAFHAGYEAGFHAGETAERLRWNQREARECGAKSTAQDGVANIARNVERLQKQPTPEK